MRPTHPILGISFFGGTSREAVAEITRTGGLLVAPAAPSMIVLCRDEDYRRALLSAQVAIADSGFMVLLWKLFTGESVSRISGLEHVKRLLEHESVRLPGAVLWVVATEESAAKLRTFLGSTLPVPSGDSTSNSPTIYVAPRYSRPVADEALLALVQQQRPRHVVIAVGGGVQDKLGQYLLERLDYAPAVHCIGAAIGFLTGDQVRIPAWANTMSAGCSGRWRSREYLSPASGALCACRG